MRHLKTSRGSNMNVHHAVICFFILYGNTGLITEGSNIITGKEGGNIRYGCRFTFSGSWRAFYKGNNILCETKEDKAQCDRYSIEYKPGADLFSKDVLYVSITNLTKSDSGKYRCVLNIWLHGENFEVRVEDAPTTLKPNWTPGPFPTSVPSTSTPTATQSLSSTSGSSTPSSTQTSTSGSSTPSSVSPKTTHQSQQQQAAAGRGTLLYVGLTLFIMIFILSAAVLIYCRKTGCEPKGEKTPQETEYANVTEAGRVYEEIREEDGQSRSPPVEISAVYTQAKYTKPKAAEGTDEYSFVTAVSSQMDTKDDPDKLTYSVVDFSNGAAASLNSAPRGDADNVVYDMPKVAATSDSRHVEQASAPLYSTVNLNQQ